MTMMWLSLHRELADLAVDVERERRVSFGESVERYDTLVRQDSVKQAVKAANAEQERRVSASAQDDPASPTKASPERAWCEGGVPSTLEHLLQRRAPRTSSFHAACSGSRPRRPLPLPSPRRGTLGSVASRFRDKHARALAMIGRGWARAAPMHEDNIIVMQ